MVGHRSLFLIQVVGGVCVCVTLKDVQFQLLQALVEGKLLSVCMHPTGWVVLPCAHMHVYSCTWLYVCIQGYTRVYKYIHWLYTSIYKGIQVYTKVYKYIQGYTSIYKGIQVYTRVYKYIQRYTSIYKGIQVYTRIYMYTFIWVWYTVGSSVQHIFIVGTNEMMRLLVSRDVLS